MAIFRSEPSVANQSPCNRRFPS